MIVIFGSKKDPHCIEIKDEIEARSEQCLLFSTDRDDLVKTYFINTNGKTIICQEKYSINVDDIKSCLIFQPIFSLFSTTENEFSQELKFWYFSWKDCLYGIYQIISKKNKLINFSIFSSFENQNKIYYHSILQNKEISFPDYLISNSKNDISKFIENNGECIIKTLHQMQLKCNDEPTMLLASRIIISDLNDFNLEGECPILVQKFIEKKFDIRVTVVGSEIFSCKIDASRSIHGKIDWRAYDMPNTPHSIFELNSGVKDCLIDVCCHLKLDYATIDLCVDHNNKYWILDINPFGKFLWIEDATGMEITKEIANILIDKKYS